MSQAQEAAGGEEVFRVNPLHPSCNRSNLLLGGDRRLVIGSLAVSAVLVFVKFSPVMIAAGAAFGFGMLVLARKLAKSDPKMLDVYQRHTAYRRRYPAQATPWRENGPHEKKIWGRNFGAD